MSRLGFFDNWAKRKKFYDLTKNISYDMKSDNKGIKYYLETSRDLTCKEINLINDKNNSPYGTHVDGINPNDMNRIKQNNVQCDSDNLKMTFDMNYHDKKGLIAVYSDTTDNKYLQDYPGPYLHGFIMMKGEYENDNYQGNFIPEICNNNNPQECQNKLNEIIEEYIVGCEDENCSANRNTSYWYKIYRGYDIRPYDNSDDL